MFLPGSYQVRPHLIPMTEQMWPIQLSGLSVREEADLILSSPD